MAKRKCKSCGRIFESKKAGDWFCSPLCKATGFFVGGGGDTCKPGGAKPPAAPHPKPIRVKKDDERFNRVREMFDLPSSERWKIAKNFTEEEHAYAKRLERRRLMEESRIFREWDWDADSEEEAGVEEGMLGESDDGSV